MDMRITPLTPQALGALERAHGDGVVAPRR